MKEINGKIAENITFPIALIVSIFNREITQELKEGALSRLREVGFQENHILIIEVPGAVEIPLIAQSIAQSKKAEVIVTLGAVIRGETSHYDYVCDQVSTGCQRVALDYNLPVIFGVLTTEDEAQAWDRLGGKYGHNGKNAIDTAIRMHNILQQLSTEMSHD